jgi:hypothetical protein
MFKGVSQCMLAVGVFYSGPFNAIHYSPLPLYLPPPSFSTAFNTHPYILYLHRCYVLWYYWCSIILFSFPSIPEFHTVIPLLLTCSTYGFVYGHTCFYVYVYLLDLSSMCDRKHAALVFLSLAHFTYHDVLQSHPFAFQPRHYFLWLRKTPLCTYTTFSWSIHQLYGIWVISIAWLLWTVLLQTSVYKCLYCILSYIPLSRCPETVSLDHMEELSLAFCGISILLSIVVVLICIPSNSV